jgi:hypothetical protein
MVAHPCKQSISMFQEDQLMDIDQDLEQSQAKKISGRPSISPPGQQVSLI